MKRWSLESLGKKAQRAVGIRVLLVSESGCSDYRITKQDWAEQTGAWDKIKRKDLTPKPMGSLQRVLNQGLNHAF